MKNSLARGAALARSLLRPTFAVAPGFAALAVIACSAAFACSSSKDGSGSASSWSDDGPPVQGSVSPGITSTYQVTYKPDTVEIPHDVATAALKSISSDGVTYTFDASVQALRALVPGKVMLLDGIALRRVESSGDQDGMFVVTTSFASITDAVQNGHIAWHGPLDFSTGATAHVANAGITPTDARADAGGADAGGDDAGGDDAGADDAGTDDAGGDAGDDAAPAAAMRAQSLRPLADSPASQAINLNVDGYKIEIQLTPTASGLGIQLQGSKEVGPLEVQLQTVGEIHGIQTDGDIEVADGELQSASVSNSAIGGSFTMSWGASASTNAADKSFSEVVKLPISRDYPLIQPYGIPIAMRVEISLAVTVALTGDNAVMKGSISVDYGGDGSFDMSSDVPSFDGTMSGHANDGDTTASSLGVSGVSFAMTAPKLGVGVGIDKAFFAGPWVKFIPSYTVTTPGSLAAIPCWHKEFDETVKAGVDLEVGKASSVFGKVQLGATTEKELFKTELQTKDDPPGYNCDPSKPSGG